MKIDMRTKKRAISLLRKEKEIKKIIKFRLNKHKKYFNDYQFQIEKTRRKAEIEYCKHQLSKELAIIDELELIFKKCF